MEATVMAMCWQRAAARVRGWVLWTLPPALVGLVCAVTAAAGVLTARGIGSTPVLSGQLVTWLVLTGCAAVCLEAMRRVGEPAGIAKDLLSAWTLPVALLLPPVYSLLMPVPLMVLRQQRVRPSLLYRRTYSTAAVGLANWAVSSGFQHYLRWDGVRPGSVPASRTVILAVALGCAAAGCALNVLLIAVAARLASPDSSWRVLLGDRERRTLDAGEICLGVAVAGCWYLTPSLALTLVLPVLLVQRSLSHAQLRAAARIDAKTGLLNAQAWQQEAEREIVRAHREGYTVAVLLADLDHFKRINDTYGHLAGDRALQTAVAALCGGLRLYDQLGRFGGEEFTVVLPRTGRTEATRVAERLRRAVADSPVVLADATVELRISIGVAVLGEHGHDLTDLLAAADHALYRAKNAGRNQIAIDDAFPVDGILPAQPRGNAVRSSHEQARNPGLRGDPAAWTSPARSRPPS